ncbi:hypothetical protein ACJX0J_036521 [Zea mays]
MKESIPPHPGNKIQSKLPTFTSESKWLVNGNVATMDQENTEITTIKEKNISKLKVQSKMGKVHSSYVHFAKYKKADKAHEQAHEEKRVDFSSEKRSSTEYSDDVSGVQPVFQTRLTQGICFLLQEDRVNFLSVNYLPFDTQEHYFDLYAVVKSTIDQFEKVLSIYDLLPVVFGLQGIFTQ